MVRCALGLALGALAAGCTGQVTVTTPTGDGGRPPPGGGLAIQGRVYDFETCPAAAGCLPVEGVTVALEPDRTVTSDPTGADGAFVLAGVPANASVTVSVDTSTAPTYVATFNANPIAIGAVDVQGVDVYVLSSADPDLLGVIATESNRDLRVTGGYLGVVLQGGASFVGVANAHVELMPPDYPMRYVNVIPRYAPTELVLLPPSAGGTAACGLFAVGTLTASGTAAIAVTAETLAFESLVVPIVPGRIALGVHEGS
jgi:hypothetical protein